MEFKFLAGINPEENKIIIFEVRADKEFAMSASVGQLVDMTDYTLDNAIEYLDDAGVNWEDLAEKIYYHIDYEENDDCELYISYKEKQKITQMLINKDYNGVIYRLIEDCSCTDYEFKINNRTYNFVTESCGQCIDDYKDKFLSLNEFIDWFYKLWKNYHLKTLPEGLQEAVEYVYRCYFLQDTIKDEIEYYLFNNKNNK